MTTAQKHVIRAGLAVAALTVVAGMVWSRLLSNPASFRPTLPYSSSAGVTCLIVASTQHPGVPFPVYDTLLLVGDGSTIRLPLLAGQVKSSSEFVEDVCWDSTGGRACWIVCSVDGWSLSTYDTKTKLVRSKRLPSVGVGESYHVVCWVPDGDSLLLEKDSVSTASGTGKGSGSLWITGLRDGMPRIVTLLRCPPGTVAPGERAVWKDGSIIYLDGGCIQRVSVRTGRSAKVSSLSHLTELASDNQGDILVLQHDGPRAKLFRLAPDLARPAIVLDVQAMSILRVASNGLAMARIRGGDGTWDLMAGMPNQRAVRVLRAREPFAYSVGRADEKTIVWIVYPESGRVDRLLLDGVRIVERGRVRISVFRDLRSGHGVMMRTPIDRPLRKSRNEAT